MDQITKTTKAAQTGRTNDITLSRCAEIFRSGDEFTLYCHASPDGDTIGSATALAVALTKLGKQAHIFVCDKLPQKLEFIGVDRFMTTEPRGLNVTVDIASRNMLGEYKASLPDIFDLSIDHHAVNTIECKERLIRAEYIACGEIIYEIVKELGIEIDQDLALPLYSAISSDSGCFKYPATRPETHMAAAELLATGIDFALINRRLFEQNTLTQIELEKAAYNSLKFYLNGKLAVVELDPELINSLGAAESDMDNLHQIPRRIKGVEVSALVRVKNGEKKISLRSNDYFDVAQFAAQNFGGGGHLHAAGCRVPLEIEDVGALLAQKLEGQLK